MRDAPLQTFFDRRTLLSNDLRQVAHRRRIEIDIVRAGDHLQAGELIAADAGNQWRFSNVQALERQWSKLRGKDAHRFGVARQHLFSDAFVFGNEDGAQADVADLRLFRTEIAAGDDREISVLNKRKSA